MKQRTTGHQPALPAYSLPIHHIPGGAMRHTATLLLAATLALAGCSSSGGDSPAPGPAQKLADLDGDVRGVGQYQKALDAWAARCTESPDKLAGYAYATVEDLRKNGVTDETEYSALTHLKESTPAGTKMKCVDIAAGYLALREGGKP